MKKPMIVQGVYKGNLNGNPVQYDDAILTHDKKRWIITNKMSPFKEGDTYRWAIALLNEDPMNHGFTPFCVNGDFVSNGKYHTKAGESVFTCFGWLRVVSCSNAGNVFVEHPTDKSRALKMEQFFKRVAQLT